MNGLWDGYYTEFYHHLKMPDERCFSKASEDSIIAILQFLAYGEWSDIFSIAGAATSLYQDNLYYCGYQATAKDIMKHCSENQEACTLYNLAKNLVTNYLELTSVVSSVGDIIQHHKAQNSDEAYNLGNQVGETVGKVVAATFKL